MASFVEPDSSVDVPVLDVTLGGRRFPARWSGLPEQTPVAVQLRETSPTTELADELSELLWQRLPWRKPLSVDRDRRTLVEAYVGSVAELDQCRNQVVEMIRAACEANIEFRQATGETYAAGRDAALRTKLDAMLKSAIPLVEPIRNVADATNVSQPVESLRATFQAALETAVDELVRKFFAMLATFVDRKLFGLVEWLPNQCCRYHFFRQVIVQENDGQFVETREVLFDDPPEGDSESGNLIIGRRTHRSGVRGRHFHRLARHRHDLMNTVRTTIGNSRVLMPPPVERLIAAVPDWLRPLVRIIDGEIFRERIIEQDLKTEDWADVSVSHEKITRSGGSTAVRDESIGFLDESIASHDESTFGPDPGVAIGPYVLVGWGPREVEVELQRRERVAAQTQQSDQIRAAKRQALLYTFAASLMTPAAVWLMTQTVRGRANVIITVIATVLSLVCFRQAILAHLQVRNSPIALHLSWFYTGLFTGLLLFVQWLSVYTAAQSWWLGVVLPVAAWASLAVAKQFEMD